MLCPGPRYPGCDAQELRCYARDPVPRIQNRGPCFPDPNPQMQDPELNLQPGGTWPGSIIQESACVARLLNPASRMHDPGYRIQGLGFCILYPQSRVPDAVSCSEQPLATCGVHLSHLYVTCTLGDESGNAGNQSLHYSVAVGCVL